MLKLSSLQDITIHDNPHIKGTCIVVFKFSTGTKSVLKNTINSEQATILLNSLRGQDATFSNQRKQEFKNLRFGRVVIYTCLLNMSRITTNNISETIKLMKKLENNNLSSRRLEMHQKW